MSDEGLKELKRLRPLIKDVFTPPAKAPPPLAGEMDVHLYRLLGRIVPLLRFEPPDLIGLV
jgi:hypothetical protein